MQWCHWQHCWHHVMPTLVEMVPMTKNVMLYYSLIILALRNAVVPLTTQLTLHDTDANTNGITGPKCHVASPFVHPDLTKGMVPLLTLLASCDTDSNISGMTCPKIMLHLILIILIKQMQWCHWWWYLHHMMVMLMLIASYDQKSHVASYFDHLYLTSGMVPLMTLLSSCDTGTSINDISWPKKLCYISSWSTLPNK